MGKVPCFTELARNCPGPPAKEKILEALEGPGLAKQVTLVSLPHPPPPMPLGAKAVFSHSKPFSQA